MAGFRVGLGEADFTPPLGLPILGNVRVDYAARGVHLPLMAKAMVIQGPDGAKLLLMALDLCILTAEQVALLRSAIAARTTIPPERMLIAATHTHSGPSTVAVYNMPKADDAAIAAFLTKAAEAALRADRALEPADLALGRSREDRVSFYRRLRGVDGRTYMNWETVEPARIAGPYGEIDPELVGLFVERAGQPRAALVNFALHPAILDYRNDRYSSDYPGYLAEGLRRAAGPEFVSLFLNGCCGNVNHIDYRDKELGSVYKISQRVGFTLATAALEAMRTRRPFRADPVAVSREVVPLRRFPISEEIKARSEKTLAEAGTARPTAAADGMPVEFQAALWLEMYAKQHEPLPAEVMVIRLGDLAVVGLPGEVFCEFGRRIKTESPAPHTIVVELANGWVSYVPVAEAYDLGGYETTPGATLLDRDSGDRLTASALRQLQALFRD